MPAPPSDMLPLTEGLLYRIAALVMADRETSVRLRSVLRPEFFAEDPAAPLRTLVDTALAHATEWHAPPSWEVLDQLVTDRLIKRAAGKDRAEVLTLHRQALRRLREADTITDRAWLESKAIEHAEDMALQRFVLRSADALAAQNGDRPEVRCRMRKEFTEALNVGASSRDLGTRYSQAIVGVVDDVVSGRSSVGRFRTGWEQIDRRIGGIGRELVVIVGEPGGFKTGTCVNLGVQSMAQGLFVAVAFLEGDETSLLYRYARRATRLSKHEIGNVALPILRNSLLRYRAIGGDLQVRYFSRRNTGVPEIESWLTALTTTYRRPDLVIVDYADLLQPPRRRYERKHEAEEDVYHELYALSREFPGGPGGAKGLAVITPCQVGRGSCGKRVVTKADIKGAFAKAAIADLMFANCQTPYEAALHPPVMRIFEAKVREAEGIGMAWFAQDKDRMLLEEIPPIELPEDTGKVAMEEE